MAGAPRCGGIVPPNVNGRGCFAIRRACLQSSRRHLFSMVGGVGEPGAPSPDPASVIGYASFNPNAAARFSPPDSTTPVEVMVIQRARYLGSICSELEALPAWARCWRLSAEWLRRRAPEPVMGAELLPGGTRAALLSEMESRRCSFNYAGHYQ